VADNPSDSSGHRARLRQRLFEGGGKALLDHELVEYLLTLAIPRRDTKAQAKAMIARFGGTVTGECYLPVGQHDFDEMLDQAERRQADMPPDELAKLQDVCQAQGQRLFAEANYFERLFVSRAAESRIAKLRKKA